MLIMLAGTGYFLITEDIAAIAGIIILLLMVAAARGKVLTADFDSKKGYYIEIAHEEGYSTLYAHLNEMKVSAGDMVNQGDEIGSVGKTGQATGAHLHFEMHKDGQLVNPEEYWSEK